MLIISHRGYEFGPDSDLENNPKQISKLLSKKFQIEIDVWSIHNELYLGHDEPRYKVPISFLKNDSLWCHAKNIEALEVLLRNGVHCFWHQEDHYTITSRGFIWAYPQKETSGKRTVCLYPEKFNNIDYLKYDYICTDYIYKFKKRNIL